MAHDEDHDVANENLAESLYKPPAQKSVREILQCDEIINASDPRIVLLQDVTLLVNGREDVVQDLTNPKTLEETCFKIKEGVHYKLRFRFYVQREMVTGLRYSHKVSKLGINVVNEHLMVGSYGPKHELISYVTPPEEAPEGMIARGKYKVFNTKTNTS